ncbi:hypothetical protein HLY00_455 [Mycolicibacterium hippocampi]|uniref:Uncharacterized protein n=1 Tax=Mycolicibacterium hippocampi TaxID=659824 RepID=A0A850PGD4_9MYCO|nr:hypothetical protein [Mycolicibacterium hippocampi]
MRRYRLSGQTVLKLRYEHQTRNNFHARSTLWSGRGASICLINLRMEPLRL